MSDRLHSLRELEHEVGILIRRVKRALAERAELVHADLPPTSYVVLAWLLDAGPCRSSDIAEAFDLDKGAVSRQVHLLTDLRLVERTPDPADGRASILTATADARRRMDEVGRQRLERLDHRLGDWTDDDIDELVATFRSYNQSLGR